MRAAAIALLLLGATVGAQTLPTVTIRFTGDGDVFASVVSTALPPPEGDLIGCGEFLVGSPSCRLLPAQRCCVYQVPPQHQGQPATLLAQGVRAPSGGGLGSLIGWGGACVQEPITCDSTDPFNQPWCVGNQDFRGPTLDPNRTGPFRCELILPTAGNVDVSLDYRLVDGQFVTAPVCADFKAPIGECDVVDPPTTTTVTTSTTLPGGNPPPIGCAMRAAAMALFVQFVPDARLYELLEAVAARQRPTLRFEPDPSCPGKKRITVKLLLPPSSGSVAAVRAGKPRVIARGTAVARTRGVDVTLATTRFGRRFLAERTPFDLVVEVAARTKGDRALEQRTLAVPAR